MWLFVVCFAVCTQVQAQMPEFDRATAPAAPDYSKEMSWAALPFHPDAADEIPHGEKPVPDSLKAVDVFFIHPTTFDAEGFWNASLTDEKTNSKTDKKPIRYQASVFNASCRVYAPRYRQANIRAFRTNGQDGEHALDLAYEDVRQAFRYYLDHYNQGRPFIIASHSQGTRHARYLLKEFIDGKALASKMVAAYVVGFALDQSTYQSLKPCERPDQTGCYLTWASYKMGYDAGSHWYDGTPVVNPVTWTRDTVSVDASKSMGTMLLNFDKKYAHVCDTKIHGHVLWVKCDLPIVRGFDNLHIADYNLFWYDIRANVSERVAAFLAASGK